MTRKMPLSRVGIMVQSSFKRPAKAEPKRRVRKCALKSCRQPFEPRSMTHKACSPSCALALGELEKARELRKERQAGIAKLKTRSDHMKAAQTAFNRYVRFRAIRWGHACISSGAPLNIGGTGGGFDAGHYRSIGSAPHLRFNLNNCWGQSKQDNRYGAGASFEYRRGLIARRGLAVVEALEADDRMRKFDIEYLIRVKKIFTKKAKRVASSKYIA